MERLKLLIEVNLNYIEYFENNDSATPSNTPSAKKAHEINLKQIDFNKFLNNYNEDNINIRNEKVYCDITYLGDSLQDVGRNNKNIIKVLYTLIRYVIIYFAQNVILKFLCLEIKNGVIVVITSSLEIIMEIQLN